MCNESTTPVLTFYHLGEGVTAFSSTRQGGYGEGRHAQFNINRYCGDSEEAISRNRAALCLLLGIDDDRLLMGHQVHQTKSVVVDENMMSLSAEERVAILEGVDALMTNVAGVCIGVSTADCIPVLLFDKAHRAVAAIHAGWRGTVQRIVEKTVAKMSAVYGTRPCDVAAQIGPGISLESFEVGDEVYEAFASEGFPMECISQKYPANNGGSKGGTPPIALLPSKWHINLPECNRLQLLAAGIPACSIAVSPICTFKQADTYFSARRLGIDSGRIYSGVMLCSSY